MAYSPTSGGNAELNMMLMGGSPMPQRMAGGMMHSFPQLWPQGVGITDRDANPDDCSCPPCYCWTRPVWFVSSDLTAKSPQAGWYPLCSGMGFDIRDADVLGQKMSFEGRECCCGGVESCLEPEVAVFDGQRNVGKVIMKLVCFTCSETEMALAKDANGTPKFARVEHPCCPQYRYLHNVDGCCGWWEYRWPVKAMQLPQSAPPIAQIVYRYHTWFLCHPIWVGFRAIPNSLGPDDQKLLLGMAIVRLWRAEREQQREQQSGQNDGNPVY